ncbi:type I-E CRISPR-associated protein Cse2/CasB [Roseateles amylovorans]|uniref:Type I-E CRISPR-associated protein Cse2/CasB n=1 Tax=Roseateles amylovorans TaxID=2978473 RepID=A0ABY6AVA9_9BURK|nr:type I-E CRISPR-associated protein Cse2/CasB [Roseateles amylovorans]UXH76792.1 type I-E CRISPR-associated protein Cse2/CasB [Roseateles amylovorans]
MSHDHHHAAAFVKHLQQLKERDRGALATLRHSLTFSPGDYPKAYPLVERFVGREWHANDARRLARYAVAGLFASHPVHQSCTLAAAWGQLMREKDRPSLEQRFIALLEADAEGVMSHLRQGVSLLAAAGQGFNYEVLLEDLGTALNERADPEFRDRLKRRWARDFYRAQQAEDEEGATTTDSASISNISVTNHN